MDTEIRVDREFKMLIRGLSSDEREQLEANIKRDGCRDPLVVWNGTLIDGHNRYEICTSNSIPFNVVQAKGIDTREDAINWIITNQLGRRNLSDHERAYLLGKRYKAEKKTEGRPEKLDQNDPVINGTTAAKLAEQNNVGEATVKRSAAFATAVDTVIAAVGDDARDLLLGADSPLSKTDIAKLAEEKPKDAKVIVEKMRTGEAKNYTEARRQKVHEDLPDTPLPNGKYRVIYADPPWSYGNTQPDYYTEQRDHYRTMTLKEICALPVGDLAEDNAVLFLWVTSPILRESFDVIKAWGFDYKASFVWDKIKHNMGHYNSVRHELLLVCTRGSCQPDIRKLFDSVVSEERTEHSAKPETFRTIIDTIYPKGRRIELFARSATKGWEVYGNQSGH